VPIRDLLEGRAPRAPIIGHIRLGTFGGRFPKQSETFIFTSSDRLFLEPLAKAYGGDVEEYSPQGSGTERWRLISGADAITVLFPFADADANFTQDWEMWGAGGIKRRCDGYDCTLYDVDEVTGEISEEEVSCLCDHEDRECASVTRLRCWMPQTGLGVWELRTSSKYSVFEINDQMRLLEARFQGAMQRIPIRLAYTPRQIRYFDQKEGKQKKTTKRFISVNLGSSYAEAVAALESERGLAGVIEKTLGPTGAKALGSGDEVAGGAVDASVQAPALPAATEEADGGTGHPAHGKAAPEGDVEEPSAVDGSRQDPEPGPSPSAPPEDPDLDKPAPASQWAIANRHIGTSGKVLRRARERFGEKAPLAPAGITKRQLEILIADELNGTASEESA
jgi:hypothetical protein